MKARITGAVPSGLRVMDLPPLSSKVYISFWTMSVSFPTLLSNNSVASKMGVLISTKPKFRTTFFRLSSSHSHTFESSIMSFVPFILDITSFLLQRFVRTYTPSDIISSYVFFKTLISSQVKAFGEPGSLD